jgi:hypothetical protein
MLRSERLCRGELNSVANKDPDLKSGRLTLDDRGRSTWEWRVDRGTFSPQIDTQRLKQLQEEAGRSRQIILRRLPASILPCADSAASGTEEAQNTG